MAYLEYYEAALSTFKRIYEPHIHTGGEWKNVHKVHIRHGGEWELAHRTDKSRYVRDTANQFEGTSGGNYTIPNGTRYVLAEMFSGGGGAGGGIRTGGAGVSGGHFICPGVPVGTTTDYATGGRGGHGYMLELWFEVEPGMYFRWDSAGPDNYGGGDGGAVGSPLELPYLSSQTASVGTTRSGSTGYDGADAYLDIYANATDGASQVNPVINIAAIGGSGGAGGTVTVANTCTGSGFSGYGVTASTGAAGADGGKSIEIQDSAYSVEATETDESNDNGGTGNSNAAGGQGGEGEMRFYPYKAA